LEHGVDPHNCRKSTIVLQNIWFEIYKIYKNFTIDMLVGYPEK
jgi:hypothetical protein